MPELEIRIPITSDEVAELETICGVLEVPMESVFADVAADAVNVYRLRYKSRLALLEQRKAAAEAVKPSITDVATGERYAPPAKEIRR